VGALANQDEREKSMESAKKYLKASPERARNINIDVKVLSGEEPPTFKHFFPGWDAELLSKTKFVDPLDQKREVNLNGHRESEHKVKLVIDDKVEARKLELELEKATKKEERLTELEFLQKFSMTKTEFGSLPKWKQIQKKKEVGLF